MHLIFDLDQTLIDSSVAEAHRQRREWGTVYGLIPQMKTYDGITEVIDYVRGNGGKIAVVTSAPGVYCGRVIRHFGWPVDAQVGYHDTAQRKPHPAPILRALEMMGNPDPKTVYSLGDMARDIIASRAAGVQSLACCWGCANRAELLAAGADHVFQQPLDVVAFLKSGVR